VEILIAMVIATILALALQTILRQGFHILSHAEKRRPTFQSVRFITEMMREEITGVYLPPLGPDKDAWFLLDETKLEFYTSTPFLEANPSLSRMARVRYEFTRDDASQLFTLKRTQQLYSGEKNIAQETVATLASGLSTVSLKAFDRANEQWKDSFKSKEEPPRAILFSIAWPGNKSVPALDFQTVYRIPSQIAVRN